MDPVTASAFLDELEKIAWAGKAVQMARTVFSPRNTTMVRRFPEAKDMATKVLDRPRRVPTMVGRLNTMAGPVIAKHGPMLEKALDLAT